MSFRRILQVSAQRLGARSSVSTVGRVLQARFSTARVMTAATTPSTRALSAQWGQQQVRSLHTSKGALGIMPFRLADIGEGIAEVEITKWHVAEGDVVQEFDTICDVQSDKANVDITSRYAGVVKKLYYAEGDMAKVGSTLVDFEVEGAGSAEEPAAPEPAATAASTPAPTAVTTSGGAGSSSAAAAQGKVLTTPAVRHIAKQNNIDLRLVTATGKGGRILKEDILAFMSGPQSSVATPGAQVTSALPPPRDTRPAYSAEDVEVPIKGLQRAMVKTMTQAAFTPHFGYADEFSVLNLSGVREAVQEQAIAQGNKLSYMPFLIKAASVALKEHPRVNAWVDEACTTVTLKGSHNIGVAVDSPHGLIVPSIKNVQDLSVMEIQQELRRLMELAKDGKLGGDDLAGGTFTISNVGSIGGTYTSPVIPPGTVAICALGAFKRVPRFDEEDRVYADTIMNVSFSADHRVLDGATIANFSNRWKQLIEEPDNLLLALR